MNSSLFEHRRAGVAVLLCFSAAMFTATTALAQESQVQVEANDGSQIEQHAVGYHSPEGDFTVDFPDGCERIRSTSPTMSRRLDSTSEQNILYAYCDRGGQTGQGASVKAFYAVTAEDGRTAGPKEVVERISKALAAKGVQVAREMEVKKEFSGGMVAEGVDVFAQEPGGAGQVWIRGLLVDGVIYLLEAWNQAGGLWEDPAYQSFFNSFKLIE